MISHLSARWRDEAALFRRHGLNEAADIAESYAADLEAAADALAKAEGVLSSC